MKRIIGVLLATFFIVMLSGCDTLPAEEEKLVPPLIVPEEVSYKTKLVERGDIEDSTTIRGEVIPIEVEYLFVKDKYTRLKSIDIGLGDEVKKGDVLLQLLTDDLLETMHYQEINIDSMVYDMSVTKELFELQKAMDEATLTTLETQFSINNHKNQMEMKALSFTNTIKSKENALSIERLKLKDMRESLENANLKSSIDGTIVYIKRLEEGDMVTDYDKLIGIADVSSIQIGYEGTDASEFTLGNEVVIKFRETSYSAKVTMTPATVPEEDKELYVDTVLFAFNEAVTDLARGNIVDITLVHASSDNTIIIPKSLLLKSGDDKLVYVLVDGLKEERYVTTGVESGIYIEITDGLDEGEIIIVN